MSADLILINKRINAENADFPCGRFAIYSDGYGLSCRLRSLCHAVGYDPERFFHAE